MPISPWDIRDREDLQQWLEERPTDVRNRIAGVLASRMAARVLPTFTRAILHHAGQFAELSSRVFRANLTSRIAARVPAKELSKAAFAAAAEAKVVADITAGSVAANSAAAAAANAAATAAEAFTAGSAAAYFAAATVEAAAFADVAAVASVDDNADPDNLPTTAWKQLRLDVNWVLQSGVSELWQQPVWDEVPDWWQKYRMELRQFLPSLEWRVWFDWYDSVASGGTAFGLPAKAADALERRIALGDGREDFWDRRPEIINAEIAAWVTEAREIYKAGQNYTEAAEQPPSFSLPAQTTSAAMFVDLPDGRIDLAPIPEEQRLLDTPQQRKEYRQLRRDAATIREKGQILGKLAAELDHLSSAMPQDFSQATIYDLWRAINRLRRTYNAHRLVTKLAEPHPSKLEETVAEELGFLLDSANNLAFSDPGLRERDTNSIPPQDKIAVEQEKRLGDNLARAVINSPALSTDRALATLAAEDSNASDAGYDPHGLQAIDQANKTRRNWFAAFLGWLRRIVSDEASFGWKKFRGGVYEAAGTSAFAAIAVTVTDATGLTQIYPSIWNFVRVHAVELKTYVDQVFHNPQLVQFIEWLLK